jgi:O-antigen ligase
MFVATLCLKREVNHAMLIAALFCSFLLFDLNLLVKNLKIIVLISLVYLVALASTFYSANRHEAFSILERQMSLIIIPVVLGCSLKLTRGKVKLVLWTFTCSIFFVCIYLLEIFYKEYLKSRDTMNFQEFLNLQIHHQFSSALNMHATYLSMYVCFALVTAVFFLFHEKKYLNLLMVPIIPVFIVCLTILSSRIIIIPLVIILVVIMPFFLRRLSLLLYLILLVLTVSISFTYVSNFKAFKERFKTDTLRELNIKQDTNSTFSFRSAQTNDATRAERWRCAVELIKERPLVGYGTGEEKAKLNEKYVKYGLTNSVLNNFDSHNQYLAFMIKSGIVGLTAYLILLLTGFFVAIKNRNYFHICFLVIIFITSLTENILESNKGILFFAFFNTFLILADRGAVQIRNIIKENAAMND